MQIQNNYSNQNFTSLSIGRDAMKKLETQSPKLRRQVAEWVKKYKSLHDNQQLIYIPKGALAKASPESRKDENTWRVLNIVVDKSGYVDMDKCHNTEWVKDNGFHITHPALQVLKEMYTTLTDPANAILNKAASKK